jgi:NAD(P)-dependent dehydrogenase (short-subunit alcohol dehydrogenase family)
MNDINAKTIVIAGASSIGKATARLFLDRGWNVVATTATPCAISPDRTPNAFGRCAIGSDINS